MCGVAGIFDLSGERPIDRSALRRMTDALSHRGPDGEGYFHAPGLGLGHRRLAVIDRDGGAQPFVASDGESALAYNGEIYNYEDLRLELAASGVRLRTRSDTEAAAELLLRRGLAAVDAFAGMFAFAWWTPKTKSIALVRDRFGEKPLYYTVTPDNFLVFASELGAILASGLAQPGRSPEALHDFFLFGYCPDPKTIYKNILKLPPATILIANRGEQPTLRKYWRADFTPDNSLTMASAKEKLISLVDETVAREMRADAPLGAFLSGGVDSSAIVASMAQGGRHVTTFTVGFDSSGNDERQLAARTARRHSTEHREELVSVDATEMIDRIAAIYGEPFADPSAIAACAISAAARKSATVALSGDGGDEIFGGYRRYWRFAAEEQIRRLAPTRMRRRIFGAAGAIYPKLDWAPQPFRLKTTLQALGEPSAAAYARAVSTSLPDRLDGILSADFKASLAHYDPVAPIAAACDPSLDPVSAAQKIDIETWLPGRMLVKIDRAAMARGLEVRAPFLDHRLAEWAFRLPASLKIRGREGKRILKASQETRIDADILYGPKRGFAPPIALWLRQPNGPIDRLRQSQAWSREGHFAPGAVSRMIDRHISGVSDCSQELWMLIMFDAFMRLESERNSLTRSASALGDCAA